MPQGREKDGDGGIDEPVEHSDEQVEHCMRYPACAEETEILSYTAESIERLSCEYASNGHCQYADGGANGGYSHFGEQKLRACWPASVHQANSADTELSSSSSPYQDDNQNRACTQRKLHGYVQ